MKVQEQIAPRKDCCSSAWVTTTGGLGLRCSCSKIINSSSFTLRCSTEPNWLQQALLVDDGSNSLFHRYYDQDFFHIMFERQRRKDLGMQKELSCILQFNYLQTVVDIVGCKICVENCDGYLKSKYYQYSLTCDQTRTIHQFVGLPFYLFFKC